ncbi:MAG: UDP-N-acetylmuramoyl-L-alanyl-D-glutamate--2,6-diaminopimelate ligase [Rhodospirillales bacterium]|nr:UDP-N-acetylmuramoyl-L-alanyl-D-glutamate--2,6-diaminopimelate ligase [Rhodospirillales bacterium]
MRLADLIEDYKEKAGVEIKGLTLDSRQVRPGYLFAALPGRKYDGRQFMADAITNGAAVILAPTGAMLPENTGADVVLVTDDNPRRLFSLMAARFYGRQPDHVAAVTGTNGKTSVAHFTQQLWQMLGEKSASLGTLGVRGAGMTRPGALTTPEPVALQAMIADLTAAGVTHLAMEASSIGLDQHRLDGVKVSAAAFTNLSRDHLDYHETMESYFEAKARLFSDVLMEGGTAVLNADVPEYEALHEIVAARNIREISYGRHGRGIHLLKATPRPDGQNIEIRVDEETHGFYLPLVGEFQVMNALCALGLVMAEAPDNEPRTRQIVALLAELKRAPGRLELVPGHPRGAVYVDYAHTPDALEMILTALRPHTDGELVCIVGCGGDRDKGKRPVMGKIASELADEVIITDDNPRSEDPATIRAEMMVGAGAGAREIGNRREAIKTAIKELEDGDVLVIAGKGHEQGQIIGDHVEPFDDIEEASKAIKGLTS